MDIMLLMKRKGISDSRIADKRLWSEVQPAQTTGVESAKRFVNVDLHCIVSNLKRISTILTLHPWKNFCRRTWVQWFRSSNSWVTKRGAASFNSFKSLKKDKCQSCQFP